MAIKSSGVCPFCGSFIQARVVETNYLRRDKCRCPDCSNVIYVCRMPGCNNYTKGGDIWDDEFCPSCTNSMDSRAISAIGLGLSLFAVFGKSKDK